MKQDEVTRLLYTERKSRCLTKVDLVELLSEYGLFLAKIVTVMVAIAVVVMLIVNATQRKRQRGELRVINLVYGCLILKAVWMPMKSAHYAKR